MESYQFEEEFVCFAHAAQVPQKCKTPLPHLPDLTTVSVRFVDYGDLTKTDNLTVPRKPGIFTQGEIEPNNSELEKAESFLDKHMVNHRDVFLATMHAKKLIYPSPWFFLVFKRVRALSMEGKIRKANWAYVQAILDSWLQRSGPDYSAVDQLYDDDMRKIEPKNKTDAKTSDLLESVRRWSGGN